MGIPSGYIRLLEAVTVLASDLDPDAMRAEKPAVLLGLERLHRTLAEADRRRAVVADARRAASVNINRQWSQPLKATPRYDNLEAEERAKVDRSSLHSLAVGRGFRTQRQIDLPRNGKLSKHEECVLWRRPGGSFYRRLLMKCCTPTGSPTMANYIRSPPRHGARPAPPLRF